MENLIDVLAIYAAEYRSISAPQREEKTMLFNQMHHVAIIVSDYEKAKEFYVEKLGFPIIV